MLYFQGYLQTIKGKCWLQVWDVPMGFHWLPSVDFYFGAFS